MLISCKNSAEKREINHSVFPKSMGFVSDYSNLFTKVQRDSLTQIIKDFEYKTTNEIAIVTVDSIEPYSDFDQYSLDLFNARGIGKKDINNGLSLNISIQRRRSRIVTGYGTEKILTDSICGAILKNILVPEFKKENYFLGTKNTLEEIIKTWEFLTPNQE